MVNICMATFNRIEFTRQSIDSLATAGCPFILTVVDNGSGDGTAEYLTGLKGRGVITNLLLLKENIGVSRAQNLAWGMEPDAGYYLKFDNDIVMRKEGWLSEMISAAERVPEIGVAAYNFEPRSYPAAELRGMRIRVKDASVGGACFLIPKRTEQLIGNWCEDYGLYGEEDADYCWRVRLSGLLCAYMDDENAGFHLPAGKAARISRQTAQANDGVEEFMHSRYRLWKDQQRRKNAREDSLFHRAVAGYLFDPQNRVRRAHPFELEGGSYLALIRKNPAKIHSLLKARGYADRGAITLSRRIIEAELSDNGH